MERETWKSKFGFFFASVGSAVGLANIWKFPYIVGQNGGAAFIIVYLICLLLIGFPVLTAEIIIGRKTNRNPRGAFKLLSQGSRFWRFLGGGIIFTGFFVSAFYSAIAGRILGYFIEALQGNISAFKAPEDAVAHYESLVVSPLWGLGCHFSFMFFCVIILFRGVRKGIEKGASVMMPLLLIVLLILVIKGLTLPNASGAITFLLSPNWDELTPTAVLIALGHSFFTLSVGQGTMITYGSYLSKESNIPASCLPIALVDTIISLLVAIAVFTIVFSVGMEPTAGPGLIFHTLPYVFSKIMGGYVAAILFFLLVTLAAITSEISAMEPFIAYLIDKKRWKRSKAVIVCGAGAFAFGIPCALSSSLLGNISFHNFDILVVMDFVATSVLIPLGGLCAVALIGWKWGVRPAIEHMESGAGPLFKRWPWLKTYFSFCFKYVAPILIIIVFFHGLGII